MSTPINLNKARKARDKAQAKAEAGQNRVAFGRSKSQTAAQKIEALRVARDLDGKKREP